MVHQKNAGNNARACVSEVKVEERVGKSKREVEVVDMPTRADVKVHR